MDFSWFAYSNGTWIFPFFCLAFMVVMMIACGGLFMRFGRRARGGSGRETARQILERRYASGDVSKDQFNAMRRDLDS